MNISFTTPAETRRECESAVSKTTRFPALEVVRVLAIVFVMFLHSPVTGEADNTAVVFFLKGFLGSGAVPIFFLLSGYLGARKINDRSVSASSYILDKCRTLLIPFLFWSCLILSAVFCAKAIHLDSLTHGSGAYYKIEPTFTSSIAAVFGIKRDLIVYQFWFLRDLMIVSVAALFLIRYLPPVPLAPWLLFLVPSRMAASLAFYWLGHSIHQIIPSGTLFPKSRSCVIYLVLWFGLGIAAMANFIKIPDPLGPLGSAAFIFLAAVVISRSPAGKYIALLGPATFWIYAVHEPAQTMIAKAWQYLALPLYGSVFCFFLVPLFVLCASLPAYFLIWKYSPKALLLLTGGR